MPRSAKFAPVLGDGSRYSRLASGGGEIRTLGRLATSPVFKTGAIGRSATPPVVLKSSGESRRQQAKRLDFGSLLHIPGARLPRHCGQHFHLHVGLLQVPDQEARQVAADRDAIVVKFLVVYLGVG